MAFSCFDGWVDPDPQDFKLTLFLLESPEGLEQGSSILGSFRVISEACHPSCERGRQRLTRLHILLMFVSDVLQFPWMHVALDCLVSKACLDEKTSISLVNPVAINEAALCIRVECKVGTNRIDRCMQLSEGIISAPLSAVKDSLSMDIQTRRELVQCEPRQKLRIFYQVGCVAGLNLFFFLMKHDEDQLDLGVGRSGSLV